MKAINKQNYNKSVKINHRDVMAYDRKMLDELYPNNTYILVGETFEDNKKEQIDTIVLSQKELIVSKYGKNSKLLYKRAGYLLVGKNEFLVILQSRLPFIILLFGIILIGLIAGFIGYKTLTHGPIIAPDYPLPPEDTSASDIKNDSSTIRDTSHKNRAAIKVAREVTISLDAKKVEFIYQNFNASNKNAVVTLCILKDGNEYAIARSGLVKAGKEIKMMDLLPDAIKLSNGVYNGRIKIDFYDEITGEKAATSTDFDDVEVSVK